MAIALDTLEYARRLRQAGFSEQQAEGQAQALAAAMTDSLATKADLRDATNATGREIAGVRVQIDRVEQRINEFEKRVDARFEEFEERFNARLEELEKRFNTRLEELEKRFNARLEEFEKRVELRLAEQEHRYELRFGEFEHRGDARLAAGLAGVRADIAQLETRLIRQLGTMMVAGIAIVSALVKLL